MARWKGSEDYHPGVVVQNNDDGTCHVQVPVCWAIDRLLSILSMFIFGVLCIFFLGGLQTDVEAPRPWLFGS